MRNKSSFASPDLTKKLVVMMLALVMAFALAACGDDEEGTDTGTADTTEQTAETGATDNTREHMDGDDGLKLAADPGGALKYDETELTAPAGEIEIEFTNDSQVPHDVVIEDADGKEIARTEVISDSSETLETTIDEPGDYTFFCSVGNHRDEGMEGKLTVEQ